MMQLSFCSSLSLSRNSQSMFAKICEELALLQESRNRTITDYLHLTAGDILLEPGMVRESVCFTHHLHSRIRFSYYITLLSTYETTLTLSWAIHKIHHLALLHFVLLLYSTLFCWRLSCKTLVGHYRYDRRWSTQSISDAKACEYAFRL